MDSELFEIEKDSGMESIVSSKDETPERKTVISNRVYKLPKNSFNLFDFNF